MAPQDAEWEDPVECVAPGCNYSPPKSNLMRNFELINMHIERAHKQQDRKEQPPKRFRHSRPNTNGITRRWHERPKGNPEQLGKKEAPTEQHNSTKVEKQGPCKDTNQSPGLSPIIKKNTEEPNVAKTAQDPGHQVKNQPEKSHPSGHMEENHPRKNTVEAQSKPNTAYNVPTICTTIEENPAPLLQASAREMPGGNVQRPCLCKNT